MNFPAIVRRLPRHKARLLRASLLVLLWLALLDFPREVAGDEIDSSWMRCLGCFLSRRDPCGVDYVWTYGPLGYLINYVYDEHLFWWKYAWELCVKFAFAWILLRWSSMPRSPWIRALFLTAVFLFLAGSLDTLYLFCLLLLGLLPLRDPDCRTPARLAAGTILLAFLSLTKFTFFLAGVGVWSVVVLAPLWGWRRRTVLALGYPLTLSILWSLLGQSLFHFPRFVASSVDIARGYSDAMAAAGDACTLYLGLAAALLFLIFTFSYLFPLFRSRTELLGIALLWACLFLVWKHGFVRQATHAPYFFAFLIFAPFAVEGLLVGRTTNFLRVALLTALVVAGVSGRGPIPLAEPWLNRLGTNGADVLTPVRRQRALAQWQHELAEEWSLPEIRRCVGDDSVDLLSYAQGLLFLNHFNYRPRPIFQSYSAYTSDLLARNAAFFRSERAPMFVLVRLQPIDERFPALEDGAALLEIFRRYRFVTQEKGILLLQRRRDADRMEMNEPPLLLQRTIAFDEAVRLDEADSAPKLVSLRFADTLRGRLTKALFRSPNLFLTVTTTDGETYSYRLIQGMAESSFLVDPLLRDHDDLARLYAGQPLPRVRSLSIQVDPEARGDFHGRISISVRSFTGLPRLWSPP